MAASVLPSSTPAANCTCASTPGVPNWLVQLFGVSGGVLLAVALAPQIWKTWRTRNASDLSYVWQTIYISGLAFTLIYLVWENSVAGWISICVEIFLALCFVALKYYLDRLEKKALQKAQISRNSLRPAVLRFVGIAFNGSIELFQEKLKLAIAPILRQLDASENLHWVVPPPEEEARAGGSRTTACASFREGNLTFSYSRVTESLLIGCVTESPIPNREIIIDELKQVLFDAFPSCKVEHATD